MQTILTSYTAEEVGNRYRDKTELWIALPKNIVFKAGFQAVFW